MKGNSFKYKKKSGPKPIPIKDRFWEKVDIKGNIDECWEWLAADDGHGRGVIRYNKKLAISARIAYKLYYGTLDKNLNVLHKCDNGMCCNPHHLKQGTQLENMRECKDRGRNKIPKFVHEKHPMAKLTWNDVEYIRSIYNGKYGEQRLLANRYGVTSETIRKIISEVTWKKSNREYNEYEKKIKRLVSWYDDEVKIISERQSLRENCRD